MTGESFDSPVRIVPRYREEPAEAVDPVRIKVTTPGGVAKFELVVDGMLMCEVTRLEIIEAIRQFASSLRF